MKTLKLFITFALLTVLALLPVPALLAQGLNAGQLHNTTLNGAVTPTQSTIVVTSCTAIAGSSFGNCQVGWAYYVDHEFGRITAISSNTLTVSRPTGAGALTGVATGHATGTRIFLGPPSAFRSVDPPNFGVAQGNIDCSTAPYPWINTINGNIWLCRGSTSSNGSWTVTNGVAITYNSIAPGLPW